MNYKKALPYFLVFALVTGGTFHLLLSRNEVTKEKKSDSNVKTESSIGNNNEGVVYAAETENTSTESNEASVWKRLEEEGFVKDGKLLSTYLDIPESGSNTIIRYPDLNQYIKWQDNTDGDDIHGIFSDLRVKWEEGTDYYDTKYVSRDEHADGDISGKYTGDLTVKWKNGESYYNDKYLSKTASATGDVTGVYTGPLTVNWANGESHYDDEYLSKTASATGDVTGVYTGPLTVNWANGTDYYDNRYQLADEEGSGSSGSSTLVGLTDTDIDVEGINNGDVLTWDGSSEMWINSNLTGGVSTSNGLSVYDAEEDPSIGIGGTLTRNTDIKTDDIPLTLSSDTLEENPHYVTFQDSAVTVNTLLKIGYDNAGLLQLSGYDGSEVTPPGCSASLQGGVIYDTVNNWVCYCNSSSWVKVSDESTACFSGGGEY